MITQELRLLRFAMNQARLSRKAAALLHLSYSALNRKLRGNPPAPGGVKGASTGFKTGEDERVMAKRYLETVGEMENRLNILMRQQGVLSVPD